MNTVTIGMTAKSLPVNTQQIHSEIDSLPQESLIELANFLEFLRFKTTQTARQVAASPIKIIKLRGIVQGADVSPKRLAEVRQELWQKFQDQPA
jgi:hypothetical protein